MTVKEIPSLVNCRGASIYLLPKLVPQYDGNTLLDERLQIVSTQTTRQDCIVLAATSRSNAKKLLGRAFYLPDETSLTGWVFKYGKPLRIKDCSKKEELHTIHSKLQWGDRYKGSEDYYDKGYPKPILLVPLLGHRRTIGVLKMPATYDRSPFSPIAEAIAIIIAQIIAKILDHSLLLQEQNQKIVQLMELGTKEKPREVFEAVTQSLYDMLECSKCLLYLSDDGGGSVRLVAETEHTSEHLLAQVYSPGQSMIGWVFKTGKPLLIENAIEYSVGRKLDDLSLTNISDSPIIEDENRYLKYGPALDEEISSLPFIAVPVKSRAGSIWGVLCAYCLHNDDITTRDGLVFNRNDLQLMQSFANTIFWAIQNDRQRKLGLLLIRMGQTWDPLELYKLIIDNIPQLVPGVVCSIFRLKRDAYTAQLKLAMSNREMVVGKGKDDIIYKIGMGKTGFCASAQATLVINHYGSGEVAQHHIDNEFQRISSRYPDDLANPLFNEAGRRVGILQLWHGLKAASKAQKEFRKLSQYCKIQQIFGLKTSKQGMYTQMSWSFVAVPIKTENGDLYGVITAGRPVEKSPFLPGEVSLLESISGRLAAILHNLEMEEDRKRLLMSLAHEINTPLQGIMADSENLRFELQHNPNFNQLSEHNLGQVQRLHLQTETIMAVLTKQTPKREFSIHNIYLPLERARKMFESEAAAKGCDILKPQPIHSHFPRIEMSLFDLELAFKNLIHNAVKYSFKARHEQRYVEIKGRWTSGEQLYYKISIQNYGVGISEEEIEQRRIFEPYYRGKRASDHRRTGAGLGLAYVRQIVEDLHHGKIEVTSKQLSESAYLTTFFITLPIKHPQIKQNT